MIGIIIYQETQDHDDHDNEKLVITIDHDHNIIDQDDCDYDNYLNDMVTNKLVHQLWLSWTL